MVLAQNTPQKVDDKFTRTTNFDQILDYINTRATTELKQKHFDSLGVDEKTTSVILDYDQKKYVFIVRNGLNHFEMIKSSSKNTILEYCEEYYNHEVFLNLIKNF